VTDSRRLLIVDDDPHIRRLLRIYLRNSGYEIHEAATGEEATELLESERFEVVLLDLILPYHGGFMLCQRVRDIDGNRPHVIIITGEDSPEMRATAEECGADDFLAKPFSAEQIVAAVSRAGSSSSS
jgi:two-component system OmpR family response regulator